MIQISDLICFISKKYFEIKGGYRKQYSSDAKAFFSKAYSKIKERLIRQQILSPERKKDKNYINFLKAMKV